MHRILLITLLLVPISIKSQIVVGYVYGNYSGYPHDAIEFNCLTHIAHAFIKPDSNGSIHYQDWFLYPELINAAHENGKKIIISIGGWGNSEGFKPMAADPHKRRKFINELTEFIKQHNYDGADIDWEYPRSEDKENFTALITEMRDTFDKEGIEILSAALPAIDWHNVFDVEILKGKFDWFGIMTYDFYGPWESKTGLNTALYSTPEQSLSIDYSMKHYLSKGVPLEKLCMGMEFAGYQFNADGLYQSHRGAHSVSYIKSLEKIKEGWKVNWHSGAKVPYLTFKDSIITIDDTSSIRYKTEYMLNNKLAGTIIWKLGLDYRNMYNEFLNIIGNHYLTVKPETPVIRFPENNSMNDYSDVYVEWNYAKAAGKYLFELSEAKDFKTITFRSYTNSPSINLNFLSPQKIYFCRVRSENMEGESEWSPIIAFYTLDLAPLFTNEISFSYFPEDFNDEVVLRYQLPSEENIIIKMYNVFGNEVQIIKSAKLQQGIHLYRIDLEEFPPDNYHFILYSEEGMKRIRLNKSEVNP